MTRQRDLVCSVAGCDRHCVAKEMCRKHYSISLHALKGECSVEGCTRGARNVGLCGMHYGRSRTGDVGPVEPLVAHGSNRCISSAGYMRVYRPGHPLANSTGWVYEHRFVAYEAGLLPLGSDMHVHHINHDKLDNRLENLEVVSSVEHGARHRDIDRRLVVDLYLSGLSTIKVAARVGTHAGNVSRMLAEAGITARPAASSRPDVDRDEVARLIAEGVPFARIARAMGCSRELINGVCRERGLQRCAPGRPSGTAPEVAA